MHKSIRDHAIVRIHPAGRTVQHRADARSLSIAAGDLGRHYIALWTHACLLDLIDKVIDVLILN